MAPALTAGRRAARAACLAFFLASANELLLAERAGFSLEKSGDDAWISDETQDLLDGVKSYLRFNKKNCDDFLEAVSALRTPGAFNVYVVKSVKFDKDAGTSSRGYACESRHDTSIVGYKAAWHTIRTADLTSIIGALVLYLLTVGSVRGFAFFLMLSTALDIVVTYMFTRPLVKFLGDKGWFSPKTLGVDRFLVTAEVSGSAGPLRPGSTTAPTGARS